MRHQHLTAQPALYSTRRGKAWRFLLMPGEYLPQSPDNYSDLYRIDELPKAFHALSPGTQVFWVNWPPWDYPDDEIEKRVIDQAKASGVKVIIWPVIS